MSKLTRVVSRLPPETLHQLIRRRGLDASGELITAATAEQLNSVLDLDLWQHSQPGRDHQFDVDRFGEWLEALVDSGDSVAARTVAAIDKELVVAGLTRYVRVFDPGIFEPTAQSDDEAIDRHGAMREGDSIFVDRVDSDGRLECEIGGYIVRARRDGAWDAIVALLIALEEGHHDHFHDVMRGCRALSNSRPEETAFHDLLLAPEQHLHDLTIDRERRRAERGFASPADARAFLKMARSPAVETTTNPIVSAYFRETGGGPETSHGPLPQSDQCLLPSADESEALAELIAEAGVIEQPPVALLGAGDSEHETVRLPHLSRVMSHLHERDEERFLTCGSELAFLANALLEGCSVQSRPITSWSIET